MNILLDMPPCHVTIGGTEWPINGNYTVGIQFELLMQDPQISPEEKVSRAFMLYYPEIPHDLPEAMSRLLWFYGGGKEVEPVGHPAGSAHKKSPKAYCFVQDAQSIYAAFWEAYGIDLTETPDMHWWKFRALFANLPSECEFCKIMGYRLADMSGMPKKQKQFYARMKKLHALKNQMDVTAALTLAERNQAMKAYITRRFAEIQP